ncbi:hypothetical protein J7T55_011098 [Diaporthe amygdali]|uniref:uncharacterized protein n=1 Tax=Phomopsis amygdali TaxID=1214568 RepID=UPI0022FF236B|nr:uncharacterized protein J7T55_011098 [Diaporthe amygdali]KAJ0107003.1 hypothetical protein J7T55_011098 [Diaporthe amygdali]
MKFKVLQFKYPIGAGAIIRHPWISIPGWVDSPAEFGITPSERAENAQEYTGPLSGSAVCLGGASVKNNKLEIHVPKKFTSERPASMLTRVSYSDISISEHPLASSLPKETETPSIQHSPLDFLDLSLGPRSPLCLEDYLKSDIPHMNIHIVSFKDATLVSVTWPHVLGDIMSASAICEAWSLVMAGRESEVPAFLSAGDEDILATAGQNPNFSDRHILQGQQLAGVWFLIWVVRYFLDILLWPNMESHSIYLPPKAVAKLKAKATMAIKAELPEAKPSIASHASPFVSTADVVFSWIICLAGRATFPKGSRRSVMIGFPCDVRDRAPSIFPSAKKEVGVWVQNASPPLLTTVPARDLLAEHGMARVAQSIRHAIITQGTETQIHAQYRLARQTYQNNGLPPLFGDTSQFAINGTNWTKANFFEKVDFSPAVIKDAGLNDKHGQKRTKNALVNGYHARPSRVGKPVYLHANELAPPGTHQPLSRNLAYLVGTPAGGYWAVGKFHPAVWRQVEEALAGLQ